MFDTWFTITSVFNGELTATSITWHTHTNIKHTYLIILIECSILCRINCTHLIAPNKHTCNNHALDDWKCMIGTYFGNYTLNRSRSSSCRMRMQICWSHKSMKSITTRHDGDKKATHNSAKHSTNQQIASKTIERIKNNHETSPRQRNATHKSTKRNTNQSKS